MMADAFCWASRRKTRSRDLGRAASTRYHSVAHPSLPERWSYKRTQGWQSLPPTARLPTLACMRMDPHGSSHYTAHSLHVATPRCGPGRCEPLAEAWEEPGALSSQRQAPRHLGAALGLRRLYPSCQRPVMAAACVGVLRDLVRGSAAHPHFLPSPGMGLGCLGCEGLGST